jgi:integrase
MADFSSTVLCFYSERNTQRRGGRLASIKKRDDGRYRARYRDTSGREHAKHFVKKTDAQRWLDEVTTSIVSGNYADPKRGRQLFHDFALEWAAAQDWKDTTRDGFPRVLVRAEKVLPEHVRLDQIDQLVIMRARVDLGKTYAPAAVALTMTYLLAIMRAAFITRRVSADATIGVRSRRRRRDAERVGPDKVPTRAEVAAIWNAAPAPYRAAIALGSAGLRIGEVLGLTVDRIDLDERSVLIDRQLQRIGNEMQFTTPKGEKARTIRLPSAVALELRRHLREHTDRDVLFRGLRGTPYMRRDQFYSSAWRPALVGAGLAKDRFVFHSLRHFAASSMLAEGVNPMAVAGHLGDTVETLHRVYAHWLRDDRDVPADALERILLPLSDSADYSRTAEDAEG